MKPKWVKKLSIDSQSPGALTQCYALGSHSARGRDSSNTSTSLEHAKMHLGPRSNRSTTNTRFLKCVPYLNPKIPRWFSLCCLLSLAPLGEIHAAPPDFGPNVFIFNSSMQQSDIQAQVNAIANQQISNQFGTQRYALLFMPGTYGNLREPP
jgi:hypothetical protein